MTKPHYSTVRRALHAEEAAVDAAECHGVLCGMLCARGSLSPHAWMDEFLEDATASGGSSGGAASDARRVFSELFEATQLELHSEDLGFQPCLPDADAPLHERTQALASWCQGFLYGLGVSGIGERSAVPDNTRELIGDFSALAQAETGIGDGGELEEMYVELVEFIRVGVLLMHEELQPLQQSQHLH